MFSPHEEDSSTAARAIRCGNVVACGSPQILLKGTYEACTMAIDEALKKVRWRALRLLMLEVVNRQEKKVLGSAAILVSNVKLVTNSDRSSNCRVLSGVSVPFCSVLNAKYLLTGLRFRGSGFSQRTVRMHSASCSP